MAQIVLGIGTSHGPMLTMPPETWYQRVLHDRKRDELWYQGSKRKFEDLVAMRAGEHLERQLTDEVKRARYDACQKALAKLAAIFDEVKPDVAVIFGDDQNEVFKPELNPAFAVYWGETIPNQMHSREHLDRMPPGIAIAVPGHIPPEGAVYPGQPALGLHLIERLIAERFDVCSMRALPASHQTIPHAYGFVYRRIMSDHPVPSVPLLINTFYPPNQPTVERCHEFGQAVLKAVQSWKSNARVALIASGGLTHFVIDEEVDRTIIEAMRERRVDKLAALGENTYQAGTSEVKNWIPLAGAMAELNFNMNLIDYVPCYRSEAGTGNAMAFVYWRP